VAEEKGKTSTRGTKSPLGGRCDRGFTESASALGVVDQGICRFGQGAGAAVDDSTSDAIFDEILDARIGDRDNRSSAALSFGDRAVAPVGSWSGEENDIHRRIESCQFFVLISRPVGPSCQPGIVGLPFELGLELAMANHHDVCRLLDTGCGVEEEIESPPTGELADAADDGGVGRNAETSPPIRSIGRFETVLERNRQNDSRKARRGPSEFVF